MSAPELKPCPFCGGLKITFGVDYDFDTDARYRWLECRDCGARTRPHYHSAGNDCPNLRQEIRIEWNTRFPDPEITALKAQYERICQRLGIALEANVDEAIAEHTKMKAEIERLKAAQSRIATLEAALMEAADYFTDRAKTLAEDECQIDHHGYCQSHYTGDDDYPCKMKMFEGLGLKYRAIAKGENNGKQ